MGKRLISFSLFGEDARYLGGALPNLMAARNVYPGWACRYYVSQEIPADLITQLRAEGAEVIPMVRRHRWDGLFWRFLATEDAEAEVVIVRDVDSRLNLRERHAVDEWLASGMKFHIMRDHPLHNGEIIASSFGCRQGILSGIGAMIARWNQFDDTPFTDQIFLAAIVYPLIREDAFVHSEVFAFDDESPVPFPTPRSDYEWVGAPVFVPGTTPVQMPEMFRPMVDARRLIVRPRNPGRLSYWKMRSRIPSLLRPLCDLAFQGQKVR